MTKNSVGLGLLLVVVVTAAAVMSLWVGKGEKLAAHEERIERLLTKPGSSDADDVAYEESLQFLTGAGAIVIHQFDLSEVSFKEYSGILKRLHHRQACPKFYWLEAPSSEGMAQEVSLWIRETAISEWHTFFEGILEQREADGSSNSVE